MNKIRKNKHSNKENNPQASNKVLKMNFAQHFNQFNNLNANIARKYKTKKYSNR